MFRSSIPGRNDLGLLGAIVAVVACGGGGK